MRNRVSSAYHGVARDLTRAQSSAIGCPEDLEDREVRLACRELGFKYGTMQHRRRVHPGFAAAVGSGIVFAQASFDKLRMGGNGRTLTRRLAPLSPAKGGGFRTLGGEPVTCARQRLIQVRRAQAGKLIPARSRRFFWRLRGLATRAGRVGGGRGERLRGGRSATRRSRARCGWRSRRGMSADLALLAGLEPRDEADWRCG